MVTLLGLFLNLIYNLISEAVHEAQGENRLCRRKRQTLRRGRAGSHQTHRKVRRATKREGGAGVAHPIAGQSQSMDFPGAGDQDVRRP